MVARAPDFVWMSHRGVHLLTGSLPEESLREKCSYSEFFCFVFSPNAEKCRPKK